MGYTSDGSLISLDENSERSVEVGEEYGKEKYNNIVGMNQVCCLFIMRGLRTVVPPDVLWLYMWKELN